MQLSEAMDVNKNALLELKSKFAHINIVDVGCARGSLLSYANKMFSSIFSFGIDPINHLSERPKYSAYLQCAIDNIGDQKKTASFFINQDDQASSLLKMDFENITSDLGNRDKKYYIKWAENLKITGEVKVQVTSLSSVLNDHFPDGEIHLLKIDAEGKDLDVVKSLESHINRVHFISLECSSHKDDAIRIFKEGCHLSEVVPYMNSVGFRIFEKFDCEEDLNNLTQMSDVVFVNKSLLT